MKNWLATSISVVAFAISMVAMAKVAPIGELDFDYYGEKDHYLLAKYLKSTNKFKWILSYDNVEAIRNLYSDYELYEFDLNYTANLKKIGAELLTCSRNLIMPSERVIRRKETCLNLKKIDLSLMG